MASREINEFGCLLKVLQEQQFANLSTAPAVAAETPEKPPLGRMSSYDAIRRHLPLPVMKLPLIATNPAKSQQADLIVTKSEHKVMISSGKETKRPGFLNATHIIIRGWTIRGGKGK
jgi:hypothetical protein